MAIIQFPDGMKWGTATAAYQIEGAAFEDGKGLSIWDTFSHKPGSIKNGENGDVACDSYHRYEEDVELLKELGVQTYRFSVSWPRIYPTGDGEVNPGGLAYYHRLVDRLLEAGIEPMCTLYHWDLPQALQDQGGWENRKTIDAYTAYAETMFTEFRGKIKHWITFNEPLCVSFIANYAGAHAPGLTDLQTAVTISHHLLVAHGKTVKRFRSLGIEGKIGYAPNTTWLEPFSSKQEDKDACRREVGQQIEWFMDPVFKGEYPEFMIDWYRKKGAVLPIEEGDLDAIRQPVDFIGINYYTGNTARYKRDSGLFDAEYIKTTDEYTEMGWGWDPAGFYKVLAYVTDRYGQVPIYITENGACYNDEPVNGKVHDTKRISYLEKHLAALSRAIESGVNIQGYFLWSLMDNFEWAEGYTKRFGIVHVDFRSLERTKKDSYYWYKQTIANNWFEQR